MFALPGLHDTRPTHQQGRPQRFLEDPALVEPTVFAEIEALVGRVNDDRVAGQPLIVEELEQPADALIHGLDAAQVIVHVALILPADEVFALELGGAESGVAGLVIGIPGPALFGRQAFGRASA